MSDRTTREKHRVIILGWREWTTLPALGIDAIKAKLDTGARTSSLHAYFIEPYSENGKKMVRFGLHPLQRRKDVEIICRAEIYDRRIFQDTGGKSELRYVIRTILSMAGSSWPIEVNLTDRENLRFRFLIGRTAMEHRFAIDPGRSYVLGKKPGKSHPKHEERMQK